MAAAAPLPDLDRFHGVSETHELCGGERYGPEWRRRDRCVSVEGKQKVSGVTWVDVVTGESVRRSAPQE